MRTTSFFRPFITCLLLCLLPYAASLRAQAGLDQTLSEPDDQLGQICERAVKGDPEALKKLKTLPLGKALLFLEKYVSPTNTSEPELRVSAAKIMANLHVEPLYEQRLKEAAVQISPEVSLLLYRLSNIRTKEAVRVIATYLYDSRRPEAGSDVLYGSFAYEAAVALDAMELKDAPVKKKRIAYDEEDIERWRRWWKSNHQRFD